MATMVSRSTRSPGGAGPAPPPPAPRPPREPSPPDSSRSRRPGRCAPRRRDPPRRGPRPRVPRRRGWRRPWHARTPTPVHPLKLVRTAPEDDRSADPVRTEHVRGEVAYDEAVRYEGAGGAQALCQPVRVNVRRARGRVVLAQPVPAATALRSSGRRPSGPATAAAAVCLPVPGLPVRMWTRMRPSSRWTVIRTAGAP